LNLARANEYKAEAYIH